MPRIIKRRNLWDLLRPQRGGSLRQMRRKGVVNSSSCKDAGTRAEDEARHNSACIFFGGCVAICRDNDECGGGLI